MTSCGVTAFVPVARYHMKEVRIRQVDAVIEGLAVMIVTSCVIPVLVLVFFLWVATMLLGIDVSVPMGALAARGRRLRSGWGDAVRKTKDSLRDRE